MQSNTFLRFLHTFHPNEWSDGPERMRKQIWTSQTTQVMWRKMMTMTKHDALTPLAKLNLLKPLKVLWTQISGNLSRSNNSVKSADKKLYDLCSCLCLWTYLNVWNASFFLQLTQSMKFVNSKSLENWSKRKRSTLFGWYVDRIPISVFVEKVIRVTLLIFAWYLQFHKKSTWQSLTKC